MMARSKRQPKTLASHAKSWLWGRHLVLETLSAARWEIVELHLANDLPEQEMEAALRLAEAVNLRPRCEETARLTQLCKTREHQGYLAKMGPFPHANLEELLQSRPERPLYLILDRLQDPQNLGAIIRSAEVFGVDAVVFGETGQVQITTAVARSSAGAVNRVSIARVGDVSAFIAQLVRLEILVVAAMPDASLSLDEFDFRRPCGVVIGNEASGISAEVLNGCHVAVRIPMLGRLGSLNAAVAASVTLYEAQRQRQSAGKE